ncbi:MAG: hypothetical protein QOE86_2196 [Solirubrobacteraceae bacterium]|nr:hypothetical protein [Solirubrobacteraceae bacterium]
MLLIVIEPTRFGSWEVSLPGDPPRRFRFATRVVAESMAREQATHIAADVVVRDAYHRVVGGQRHGAGSQRG